VCSAELNINEVRNVFSQIYLVAKGILSSANVIMLVIMNLLCMFRFLVVLGRFIYIFAKV
jgi:hypothetical protein